MQSICLVSRFFSSWLEICTFLPLICTKCMLAQWLGIWRLLIFWYRNSHMELISQTTTNMGEAKSFFVCGVCLQNNDITNQKSTPFGILMESARKKRSIPNLLDWNISKKLLQQMYKLRLIQWVFIKCRSLSRWFRPGQRTGWCLCVFVIGHLIVN